LIAAVLAQATKRPPPKTITPALAQPRKGTIPFTRAKPTTHAAAAAAAVIVVVVVVIVVVVGVCCGLSFVVSLLCVGVRCHVYCLF